MGCGKKMGSGRVEKWEGDEGFWEWGWQDAGIRRHREQSSILGWDLWLVRLRIPTGVGGMWIKEVLGSDILEKKAGC